MQAWLDIERVDLSLSAGQRTALGLGPIGSDPRDAAVRASLVEVTPAGAHRCVGMVTIAFERAATTRSQLRTALVAAARTALDAARDGEAEGAILGARIRIE